MTVTSAVTVLAASGGPGYWLLPFLTGLLGLSGLVALAILVLKPVRRR